MSTGIWWHYLLLEKINSYWRMWPVWTLELGRLTHPCVTVMETHGLPGEIKYHSQHDRENARRHFLLACQLPVGRVRSCPTFTNQTSHLLCPREEWREGHSDMRRGELFSTWRQTAETKEMHFSSPLNIILWIHTCQFTEMDSLSYNLSSSKSPCTYIVDRASLTSWLL